MKDNYNYLKTALNMIDEKSNIDISKYLEIGLKCNSIENDIRRKYFELVFSNLDTNNIFIGDIYKCTNIDKDGEIKLRLVAKNTILLKTGVTSYINLSKIKNSLDIKILKKILSSNNILDREKMLVNSDVTRPYVGDYVAKNVKSYENLKQEKISIKELKKKKYF